jgi:transcriptional regulator with XRE-family HTH domain
MAKTAHLDPAAPATIKSWRTDAMKLSRIELSARLGVSTATVSNWELGQNEPSWRIYGKLAALASGPDREWFKRKAGLTDDIISELANPDAGSREDVSPFDRILLEEVLDAVQDAANQAGVMLPVKKFAEIAAEVYDGSRKTGCCDRALAQTLIAEARCPSNLKVSK